MNPLGGWPRPGGARRPPLPAFAQPTPRDLDLARRTLERLLHEAILPFWQARVLDAEAGGYRLHHDADGRWKGPASRQLVSQARTLWFFARLARGPTATAARRDAAEHGFRFLRERLWDEKHGGFFWALDARGSEACAPDKHVYGQAFGLYALSEWADASGDAGVLALARRLFELLEERAHDPRHGGYRECFARDWTPLPGAETGRLGAPAALKLANTHLHMLEAITRFHAASGDALARERVVELIGLLGGGGARRGAVVLTDRHRRDWTPLAGRRHDRCSYGHQLESVWLLAEAARRAGLPTAPLAGLLRARFEHALRLGFDREHGGFFESGPSAAPADRRTKLWWVQAEALLGALEVHALTGAPGPLACFLSTLDWIASRQVDWERGGWHAEVSAETGRPSGDKAGPWKTPYHEGRAVLESLERLASRGGA